MTSCQNCGKPVQQHKTGARRKWCSDRCRKIGCYTKPCVDCGGPTGISGTAHSNQRCAECSRARQHDEAFWTRDTMLAAGHRWRELAGRWPTSGDWNAYRAGVKYRHLLHTLLDVTGPWPHLYTVQLEFGSWPGFMAALGAPTQHGGRGVRWGQREREYREILARVLSEASGKTSLETQTIDPRAVAAAGGRGSKE